MNWVGTLLFVDGRVVASIYTDVKGRWQVIHLTWVRKHMNPTMRPCKTQLGIMRRAERYAQVWIVAGKPDGDAE